MKKLLTKRNVETRDENGNSLLMWACLTGMKKNCEILLNTGALVDIQDHEGETALLKAASKGHDEVCIMLLKNKAHINQQSNNGGTPLHSAVVNGHVHTCALLLKNNANVNQPMNDGRSPLHVAAHSGCVYVCSVLLKNKAHVNQQMKDGRSPLHLAAQTGHIHICTLLLENDAHVNQQMLDRRSPLHLAAHLGNVHICALLLANNAHVSQQCNSGITPLMLASGSGNVEVCECLLQANAAINLKNYDEENALFYAVREKEYDICKLLIHHGADMNILRYDGKSVLQIAYSMDDETIISLIKEHQNINTVNKEIQQARIHLKKLQVKQLIDTRRESLEEMEKLKKSHDELKQLLLEKQEEKGSLEVQVEFLVQDTNDKRKRLSDLNTGYKRIKPLLEKQYAECQETINRILDEISDINESIKEYTTKTKALKVNNTNYEQQKREYEFYNKCFQEGKYNEIIKELDRECPICFEEMLTPTKIFQCSQGHLLCETCFEKVSATSKQCPFCKRDVVTTPIRNRALEEAIENEARTGFRGASWN